MFNQELEAHLGVYRLEPRELHLVIFNGWTWHDPGLRGFYTFFPVCGARPAVLWLRHLEQAEMGERWPRDLFLLTPLSGRVDGTFFLAVLSPWTGGELERWPQQPQLWVWGDAPLGAGDAFATLIPAGEDSQREVE